MQNSGIYVCDPAIACFFVGEGYVCASRGAVCFYSFVALVFSLWPLSGWADPGSVIAEVEALVLVQQASGVDYVRLAEAHLERGDLGKAQRACC